MKTLSLRSRAALTSAIRAPRPADELQDKIKDLTFWPAGNPGSSSGSPCGPVAVGGAADPWIAVPGTAADHPVLAVSRYSCAAVAGVASVSVVPAVLRPLINIAVDVVATPRDSARSCRPTLRSPASVPRRAPVPGSASLKQPPPLPVGLAPSHRLDLAPIPAFPRTIGSIAALLTTPLRSRSSATRSRATPSSND